MIAVVIVILALAFAPALRDFSTDAQNRTTGNDLGLDCTNSSISRYDKGSCLYVDYMPPLFIGLLLALAGAVAGAKAFLS